MLECCVGCEHHKLITHISKTEVFSSCTRYRDIMEQVKCMSNREQKMIEDDNMRNHSNNHLKP